MSWQSVLFSSAIMTYVVAALIYVRMAEFRSTIVSRFIFMTRLLAQIAILLIAYEVRPTIVAIIGSIYVAMATWSWRRQSIEEIRSGFIAKGAARALASRIAV